MTNFAENETAKQPTVDRTVKPILTEVDRRQIAADYRVTTEPIQVCRRTGLKNLGNSCYMNSVIQSLSFHFDLTNYFLSGEFSRDINVNNKLGSRGAVVREWFRLNYALWSQQYSCLSPQPFKITVGNIQRVYLGSQQQDAHEFLVFLLDALHEDLNQVSFLSVDDFENVQKFVLGASTASRRIKSGKFSQRNRIFQSGETRLSTV